MKLHDLSFKPMIGPKEIAEKVTEIGASITEHYAGKEVLMIPVLKGAFIFAADLARAIQVPLTFRFVLLSTYGDDTESTQKVQEVQGLDELDLNGQHVLIVEDIVDTGFSAAFLRKEIMKRGAASVKVAAMLYKPDAFKGDLPPEFYGFDIPNEFVVGYGLDYAQHGRELPGIYVKE